MDVMFISRALVGTSGAGVGARMHLSALRTAVGENHVFVVDLSVHSAPRAENNYIAYGKYRNKVERIKRHMEGNSFYISSRIIKDICDRIRKVRPDFIFIDDSVFGNLVRTIKTAFEHTPVVTFYHDVKAELYPKWMKNYPWFDRINWKIEMCQEKLSARYTDANIVLNASEDALLYKHYGLRADYYLPVSVEKETCCTENPYPDTSKRHILFVGTSYAPNITGVKWFCQQVLPQIKDSFDLWIVGKGLEILKGQWGDPAVHVIGFAEHIAGYYTYADAVIAPLTDGGGMKIKTAEAIAYGKVFVGSSESLRGYYEEMPEELIGHTVFQCDEAQEYVQAFKTLASSERVTVNQPLIDLYEKKYSKQAAVETLIRIIQERGMGR